MTRRPFARSLFYLLLLMLVAIWLAPPVVTFISALKSPVEFASKPFWELPEKIALDANLAFAWTTGQLGNSFVNSTLYASLGAAAAIFLASLAAYSLVRLKPRGNFGWFLLIYSGTIFPFQMYLLPLYYLYLNTHLYDTQLGLTLFYIAICIPFCLFLLRNYFTTIPIELVEAARLDGLSNWGLYRRIFVPLSFAPIAALFLFQFTWIWNDLLFGITLARADTVRPIMAGLAGMRGIYSSQNMPGVLAGALIASAPTVVIFLLLRKYLLQGLVLSTPGE